jgi:hypothetical protein
VLKIEEQPKIHFRSSKGFCLASLSGLLTILYCCVVVAHSEPRSTRAHDKQKRSGTHGAPSIIANARGFGTQTPAGSGRHLSPPHTSILTVSTLHDSGPGSLRSCIEHTTPRTCVFEVGGTIALRAPLRIRSPYITVAGQTSPSPGITITGSGLAIETHDVLLQHLSIRPGDSPDGPSPQSRDGVSIGAAPPRAAFNVVLDHLSVSWAIDENISTWHRLTHDVTIAHSIIAEGLYNSIHPKGAHSKGVMVGDGSQRITLIANLIASNEERNPYVKPGTRTEVINNVVYGWGSRGGWSLCNITNNEGNNAPVLLSFVGNTYIPGPWSFITRPIYARTLAKGSRILARDNRFMSPEIPISRDWDATFLPSIPFQLRSVPFRSPGRARMRSARAYEAVLKNAGSRPFDRSPIDARIIREVKERTGSLKDCITGCARAASPPPDPQSISLPLRLPASPLADNNRDGYTNLENWLMDLARTGR